MFIYVYIRIYARIYVYTTVFTLLPAFFTYIRACMLVWFHDFHGWDMHALWDDTKFATTHCSKIEKIAMVGESKWEEWMAKVCKPFTMAKIEYFDVSQIDDAWKSLE